MPSGQNIADQASGYVGKDYHGLCNASGGSCDYWSDPHPPEPWCEFYLSEIWRMNGIAVPTTLGGSVYNFAVWAQGDDRWTTDIGHPRVGDAIVYNNQSGVIGSPRDYTPHTLSHVGIVRSVDSSSGSVMIVENDGDFVATNGDVTTSHVYNSSAFTPSSSSADANKADPGFYVVGLARADKDTLGPTPSPSQTPSPPAQDVMTGPLWGYDSQKQGFTTSNFGAIATDQGSADFYAGFLGNKDLSKNWSSNAGRVFTQTTVSTAQTEKIPLVPIERQFDDGTTHDADTPSGATPVGVRVGNQTVADAKIWGIPAGTSAAPGTAIFIDLEGGQGSGYVDEQFIRDWFHKVLDSGYTPGFYGSDTDTFNTEFCKAVQDDSDVASKALLWTFDPNPAGNGNAVHKPGPMFSTHIITCSTSAKKFPAERTVLDQYNQNISSPDSSESAGYVGVDQDLFRGSMPVWKP